MSRPRLTAHDAIVIGVVALAALLQPRHADAATDCKPMLADLPPIFEATYDLAGGKHVHRQLLLPADSDVLIFAREHGVDVRMDVKGDGKSVVHTDNPVFRTGTQRVALRTAPHVAYAIDIVAKEYTPSRGRVDVRAVISPHRQPAGECVDLNRSLAAADAQFADGQMVTLGLRPSSEVNAAAAYQASADGYATIASSLARNGPSALLAETQHAEGAAWYWGVQDWEKSCVAAERALHTYESIGSQYGAAKAEALIGAALMETAPTTTVACGIDATLTQESRPQRIRRLLMSAAAVHEKRGEAYDQALALNDLGLAFRMADDYQKALSTFERALGLYERLGETPKQALVLQNIAWTNYGLGRLSSALPLYSRALTLLQPQQDPTLYAAILNNSALANTLAGNYDAALHQLSEALDLVQVTQDKWWQVTILDNVGLVYDRTGETGLALDFYTRALAMADAGLISSGRRTILSKMATILREQGEYTRAISTRKEALSLAQSPSSITSVTIDLAADYRAIGNLDRAEQLLRTVLTGKGAPTSDFLRAIALLERGHVASGRHLYSRAEADYREARSIFHGLDLPQREFPASLALAQSLADRSATRDALHELTRTLQLAEQIRLQSANPELRARLLAASRSAFDLKISLLADRYFASGRSAGESRLALEALQTAEQARARALFDFRRLDLAATGASQQLLKIRQSVYAELSARRLRLESLLEAGARDDPDVVAIRADIAMLRQRLTDIETRLAAASVGTAGAEAPWALDAQAIPKDAAIIEYWLGEKRALAWSITREQVSLVDLGASRAVSDTALALHASLREGVSGDSALQLSERLSRTILAPLAANIAGKTAVTFVADGALHYTPFAVLRTRTGDRTRFLIQDYDLAVAPSIRSLFEGGGDAGTREAPARMLLVADPVYDANDPRVRQKAAATKPAVAPAEASRLSLFRGASEKTPLRRLPGTATEAAAIRALFRSGRIDTLEGTRANRESFLATDFSSYRFIHIASHAVADPDIPQLSALILSTVDGNGRPVDGQVLAADVMNLRFDTEIVVLSGCETALGKSVAGEGLVGLQYVMLARGAHSVLSSLWQVSDRRTAELMSRFYSALLTDAKNPRQSFGNALRSMIADGADPSLWSAFSLTTTALDDHLSRPNNSTIPGEHHEQESLARTHLAAARHH